VLVDATTCLRSSNWSEGVSLHRFPLRRQRGGFGDHGETLLGRGVP
jgi:hypothetical protein